MKVTFYGHACFGIEVANKHLLFDPFISPNELAAGVDIEQIPADYILISHAHFDHVADVEQIAKRTGASLISNYEIITYYGAKGLKGHPMNHGGHWKFDFGTVQYVNAVHTSSFEDGAYGGNPGGFVISTDEGSFYYSGDTA
ncbi:MAG: metal-dependent hydrolase, partial [Bacteroidota bacterium]